MFFDGKELPIDRIKTALRKATIAGTVLPMLCGSAFKNKGVQPLLDAVVDFLPSPLEAKTIVGRDPKTGDEHRRARPTTRSRSRRSRSRSRPIPYGNLTYFRVYSGVLNKGSYVYNARSGRKERIGRILRMHANHREDIDAIGAGDIAAAVGLTDTRTGDTLCDEKIADRARDRSRSRSRSSHQAIEPKTKADQDKLGLALDAPRARRPDLPDAHRRRDAADDHRRHGRAAPRDHPRPPEARVQGRGQRRQAAGRL